MPQDEPKRQLLANLARALATLANQLRQQHGNAQKITLLAAQAEAIAERAMGLNRLQPGQVGAAVDSLVADVKTLAAKAADAADRAAGEVLLGRQVAEAIESHSRQTADMVASYDTIPDVKALRALLRPLVNTLAQVPERMKADRALRSEVDEVSAFATGLAAQADDLAAGGFRFNQAAIELGRGLRRFAEHAATFSLNMQRDALVAIDVVDRMSQQTASLVAEPATSAEDAKARQRLAWLAQNAPRDRVESAAPQPAGTAIPAARSRSWLT